MSDDLQQVKQELFGKMVVLADQMGTVLVSVEGVGKEMRSLAESFRSDVDRLREDVDARISELPCQAGREQPARDSRPKMPATPRVEPPCEKTSWNQVLIPAGVAAIVWVILEVMGLLVRSM